MDICQREGLYQVDLLSPAAEKITQQEYHAQRRGQLNLDMANMEIMAEGIAPMKTKFETNKEKIRNAINDIAERAKSFEEFQRLLKAEYGIQVKDHRGRFSYLTSDRQKYISARKLGSHYDREYLLQLFEENALAAEQNQAQWHRTILSPFCSSNPTCVLWLIYRIALRHSKAELMPRK
mgnify:CR=1 FL=1